MSARGETLDSDQRAAGGPPLELVATIPMPGVKGRIDHFSADAKNHRVFLAALGNDTVEVIDTERNQRASIPNLGEPQGVAYLPESNRLVIANGSANRIDVVDATSLAPFKHIEGTADADNVRYEPRSRAVYVGYGNGALRVLDAMSGESSGDIALPGHPESFQLEGTGTRIFVNVPSAHGVIVVDSVKREIVAKWETEGASGNYAMALDQAGRRLFVAARSPALLLVFDIGNGKVVSKLPVGKDVDDMYFDPAKKRLYVICGEGKVDVIRQDTPDRYALEAAVATAPRARTGLYVPEEQRLYVAAPAALLGSPARVLVYRVH